MKIKWETTLIGQAGKSWPLLTCVTALLWMFFTVYLLRLDQVIGMVVDDAWYVLLGKALAEGGGYMMINAPTPGIRPITPPIFPALLAFCWWLLPDFPANLWLFKSVSIAAMLGTGFVAFLHFKRDRGLSFYFSLGIAAAIVFYPGLVFMATATVMSECVFTFIQLSAIVTIEGSVRLGKTKAAWCYAVLGGMLAASAYLIRSAGIGLLVAAVIYLLKERCLRQFLIVAVISAMAIGSWMGYAHAHMPTPDQRMEQASSILQPYHEQFWQRLAGNVSSGTITARELPERIWQNLSEISRVDMGAVSLYAFYRAIEPGQTVLLGKSAIWFSLILTTLAIIGFIAVAQKRMTLAEFVVPLSLGITVLWGWEQFRFLLPLIPFLIFYQLMGVSALLRLCRRFFAKPKPQAIMPVLTIIVWVIVALNIYANLLFIEKLYTRNSTMNWQSVFAENVALMQQVKKLPANAVLATQNPALVHLFTGHKTVALGDPSASWEIWNRLGVRYLVFVSANPLPPPDPAEGEYQTIYRQIGRFGLRIVDLGPPLSRPVWKKQD